MCSPPGVHTTSLAAAKEVRGKLHSYVHVDHHPEAELIPDVLVVGMHGPLFFAYADNFRNAVTQHVNSDHPSAVVVEFSAVTIMDMDGIPALGARLGCGARQSGSRPTALRLIGASRVLLHYSVPESAALVSSC